MKHYLVDEQYPQRSADIISDADVQTAVIMAITSLGIQMYSLNCTLPPANGKEIKIVALIPVRI